MKIRLLILLIFISINSFSQQINQSFGFWNLNSINGAVNINGNYRNRHRNIDGLEANFQKSLIFGGGLKLKTKSYVWHPGFLLIDIDLDYNPETSQQKYLVIPDRSESRSVKSLNIKATLFNQKQICA